MSYNQDLKNTNIPARVAIIVFLNQAQDQFKLRQFGDIVYFLKRKKYCLIYVNQTGARELTIKLNKLHFVKKAEISPTSELNFSREHEEGQINKLATEAEQILEENEEYKQ